MLLHTGRSGLRPSDLCLFNTDLYRGPFPNNTPMNVTQAFLMRNPWHSLRPHPFVCLVPYVHLAVSALHLILRATFSIIAVRGSFF